ncbi:hypothetical protein [Nostoc sp.]|uniref:hypothetical protein n=1 Tax=Nostoc sp. TaxID=1180 RepID=UPI002FFA0A06
MQDSRIRYKEFLPPTSCLQTRSFVLHTKKTAVCYGDRTTHNSTSHLAPMCELASNETQ